jgi:nitrite reductase/ring-hydroxylating ferredoxin subunit
LVSTALGDRLRASRAGFIIAHVPTGLWLLSGVADLLAIASGRTTFVRLAWLAQLVGVIGTVGLHLVRPARPPVSGAPLAEQDLAHLHDWLNNALPVVFALSVGRRTGPALARRRPPAGAVLLTLLGVAGLFLSRELAKRRADDAPADAATDAADAFVPVATLADVAPGTMTMVEVDNHTIALANVDGDICAFSNVCSHRSGPLAEGTLDGDQVTCPWHKGVYNVRTGAVVSGPPPTSVPTYAVRVDGDQILIQRP